jgi:microcystin-dependent protein
MFSGNFAPNGWAFCNGQILPISQNTALFSLIGTFYGCNGSSNFALPNLQGQAPMHAGNGPGLSPRDLGETGGEASVTLLAQHLPNHNHNVTTSGSNASTGMPASGEVPAVTTFNTYGPAQNTTVLPDAVGGNGAHNNLQPYQAVSFIIALQGVFPSRG